MEIFFPISSFGHIGLLSKNNIPIHRPSPTWCSIHSTTVLHLIQMRLMSSISFVNGINVKQMEMQISIVFISGLTLLFGHIGPIRELAGKEIPVDQFLLDWPPKTGEVTPKTENVESGVLYFPIPLFSCQICLFNMSRCHLKG